jgi:hypothetical protein
VPKEDELVGAPQRHAQVLHLMLTPDHRTNERPCTLQVTINQVVDDDIRCHTGNQRDQQDCCPTTELITPHHPSKDQDRAPQRFLVRYVQSQGHHQD